MKSEVRKFEDLTEAAENLSPGKRKEVLAIKSLKEERIKDVSSELFN